MNPYLQLVKEFHQTFEHPYPDQPVELSQTNWKFRYDFLKEELEEFRAACEAGDMPEVLDALEDLQYVLSGAVLQLGLSRVFDIGFREVHRSNMSKSCSTPREVLDTLDYYQSKGIEVEPIKVDETTYLIKRTLDGKVLKSTNWSKPQLASILADAA